MHLLYFLFRSRFVQLGTGAIAIAIFPTNSSQAVLMPDLAAPNPNRLVAADRTKPPAAEMAGENDERMTGDEAQTGDQQKMAAISGTVTYRQRIALPPNAKIVVKLEDVSRADAPSTVIAEQTIVTTGQQVPIPFTLTYDPSEIQPMGRYTVRAQIFYGDRLRWTSTKMYPVINQGDSEAIEIQLEPVR